MATDGLWLIFGDSGLDGASWERDSDGACFSVWTGAGRQRQDVGDAVLEELRPALAQLWLREENINDNVRLADWETGRQHRARPQHGDTAREILMADQSRARSIQLSDIMMFPKSLY